MSSELDFDTALTADGEGRFRGTVSDRWGVLSGVPNGGFMMCFALRALIETVPKPDVLTLTAHFLRPGSVGPITVETELVKVGRSNATAVARVLQERGEVLRMIATFGQRDPHAVTIIDGAPPALPPLPQCVPHGGPAPAQPDIAKRFDNRLDPTTIGWMMGKPSGDMTIRAYMRLSDGREPDTLSLPLFADGLPPPLFNRVSPNWVPTVELTLHVRARPAPGWLRAEFRTRFVSGGLLEEDGQLWDSDGQLIALSRQLASMPR